MLSRKILYFEMDFQFLKVIGLNELADEFVRFLSNLAAKGH